MPGLPRTRGEIVPGQAEGTPVLPRRGAAGAGEVAPQGVRAAEPAAGRYGGDCLIAALQEPLGEHDAMKAQPRAGSHPYLLAEAAGKGARGHRCMGG